MYLVAIIGSITIESISVILKIISVSAYCFTYRKRLCGKVEPDFRDAVPPWLLDGSAVSPVTYTQQENMSYNNRIREYLRKLQRIELTPALLIENLRPKRAEHHTLPARRRRSNGYDDLSAAGGSRQDSGAPRTVQALKLKAAGRSRPSRPPLLRTEYNTDPVTVDTATPTAIKGNRKF